MLKIKYLSIFAKMLASTLLVVVLISTSSTLSIVDEQQSGICGCPMEILETFHEDRIPATIFERVCHQVGMTCGASLDRAPVSSVSNNFHGQKFFSNIFCKIYIFGTKIQIFVKDFIFQFWDKNSTMSES